MTNPFSIFSRKPNVTIQEKIDSRPADAIGIVLDRRNSEVTKSNWWLFCCQKSKPETLLRGDSFSINNGADNEDAAPVSQNMKKTVR